MCGHGTIRLAVTLAHLARIDTGFHRVETPAGVVTICLEDAHSVTVTNVESHRITRRAHIPLGDGNSVTGDVAYGGNWFVIIGPSPLPLEPQNIGALTILAIAIRSAANAQGLGGALGKPIDHVIFHAPSPTEGVTSRNFVLCPDGSYDRSPCGTGSSARLACLAADNRLRPGDEIVQECIIGSPYRLSYQPGPTGGVIPSLTGQAFVMNEGRLFFSAGNPFRDGIPSY